MLYDVSSSYYEGHTCPLARSGHNRDGKKGLPIIVYGLLTDGEGRPVAVDVYPGNTGDPTTVPDQVEKLRQRFGLSRVVLVGDRGMLTEAQIGKLKEHPGLGWISALRGPAIRELVETESLQLSLFDETNLAEITSPEYPGERLIACFNPLLAEERRRKRGELIEATEKDLGKIAAEVKRRTRTPLGEAEIALKAGKVLNRYKVAKHFSLTIADGVFRWTRREDSIRRESELDGIYVVRTNEPAPLFGRRRRAPLQEPGAGGTRLPQFEGPGPADSPHPSPHRRPCAGAHPGVHAGFLCGVAHAPELGPATVRR